jgi:hypothetical protein
MGFWLTAGKILKSLWDWLLENPLRLIILVLGVGFAGTRMQLSRAKRRLREEEYKGAKKKLEVAVATSEKVKKKTAEKIKKIDSNVKAQKMRVATALEKDAAARTQRHAIAAAFKKKKEKK